MYQKTVQMIHVMDISVIYLQSLVSTVCERKFNLERTEREREGLGEGVDLVKLDRKKHSIA